MKEEYEYSFKVKSIIPFIKYCEKNKYHKYEYTQTRTLYKNNGPVMARITENKNNKGITKLLDFKDDNLNSKSLKVCRETETLEITKDNKLFVDSLLKILELDNKKVLKRKRITYSKKDITFEIDHYTSPKMNVLAIEGDKKVVDKVYQELKDVIEKYKIEEKDS